MRFLLLIALWTGVAFAQQVPVQASAPSTGAGGQRAQPVAQDPGIEARLLKLAEELRCLVCQNETLAASHAELAVDLKKQIREQMKAGKSDAEIVDYLVARYGDFVLYRPPLKPTTLLLWVGPFALLLLGVVLMLRQLKARQRAVQEAQAPSDAELARAQRLLSGGDQRP